MHVELTEVQASWKAKAEALAAELPADASFAADAVSGAARAGLLDPQADLLAYAAAVEAIAYRSPSAAMCYALHATVMLGSQTRASFGDALVRGERIGALALSADDVPAEDSGRLTGGAAWVAPIVSRGLAVVGARTADGVSAFAVTLGAPGIESRTIRAAGFRGVVFAHLTLRGAEAERVGATIPLMAHARLLIGALALGIGVRALAEALTSARAGHGADAGEQTVQGLLADSATELDAARLMTWTAARQPDLSLADASVAKLAATSAAERAVERATQVVGVETFRQDHIIEQLSRDVRALELFAGRTEALRDAVADEILPRGDGASG